MKKNKTLSPVHQYRANRLRALGDIKSLTSVQIGEFLDVPQTTVRRWWTGAVPMRDLVWEGIKTKLKKAGYEL